MSIPLPEHMLPTLEWIAKSLITDRHGKVRPEVHFAYQWLKIMSATSDTGSESDSDTADLDPDDLIATREAAQLLRCTPRWVTQIKADLGGIRPAGGRQIYFPRRQVVQYAKAREDHLHEQLAKRGNPHN